MRVTKLLVGLVYISMWLFNPKGIVAQYPGWSNFTCGDHISDIAFEGNKIWIGTHGGLVCLDTLTGNMSFYNHANSGLPVNRVTSIAVENDIKWIGTTHGLVKFDGSGWTVYDTSNSGLPYNGVRAIVIEGNNKWFVNGITLSDIDMWVSMAVVKFDGINWDVYNENNSILPSPSSGSITTIAIEGRNKWIGTTIGLIKFDGVRWTLYNTTNSMLPYNYVSAITIEGRNKWIASRNRSTIAKFDDNEWTVYDLRNYGAYNNGSSAIAVEGDTKWIGTICNGLIKFDGTRCTQYYPSNSGLPSEWVTVVKIEGNHKWIGTTWGTTRKGVARFDGETWSSYNTSFLPSNEISAIAIEGNNKWIGTDKGLVKFDGIEWSIENFGLPFSNIIAIVVEGRNKWIAGLGERDNLVKIDDTGQRVVYDLVRDMGVQNYNPRITTLAIEGTDKWIGVCNNGSVDLIKFSDTTCTVYDRSNSPQKSWITSIVIEGRNKWIGTLDGLLKFDDVNWIKYDTSNSGLHCNQVRAIGIEGRNKWIGTLRGIAKFDGARWTVYDTSNSGLLCNRIETIAIEGNIKWFGTNKGVVKFDDIEWKVYQMNNSGLPSNFVNTIVVDGNDKWIGTLNGGLAVYSEVGVEENSLSVTPQTIELKIHPNPARGGHTTIRLNTNWTKGVKEVKLCIYDVAGKLVKTFTIANSIFSNVNVTWNGKDDIGKKVSSGVYFCNLYIKSETGGESIVTNKLVLLR